MLMLVANCVARTVRVNSVAVTEFGLIIASVCQYIRAPLIAVLSDTLQLGHMRLDSRLEPGKC
jgi:hypothetical protein